MKLLFQPAEEGFAGAKEMIKDGCLEAGSLGPRVDYVYGIHIWSCKILKQNYSCPWFTFVFCGILSV